jgi:hypothetical protein
LFSLRERDIALALPPQRARCMLGSGALSCKRRQQHSYFCFWLALQCSRHASCVGSNVLLRLHARVAAGCADGHSSHRGGICSGPSAGQRVSGRPRRQSLRQRRRRQQRRRRWCHAAACTAGPSWLQHPAAWRRAAGRPATDGGAAVCSSKPGGPAGSSAFRASLAVTRTVQRRTCSSGDPRHCSRGALPAPRADQQAARQRVTRSSVRAAPSPAAQRGRRHLRASLAVTRTVQRRAMLQRRRDEGRGRAHADSGVHAHGIRQEIRWETPDPLEVWLRLSGSDHSSELAIVSPSRVPVCVCVS